MSQPVIEVLSEPKGSTYKALLRYARSRCASFSLVWRDQLTFEASAAGFARTLEPYLLRIVRTDAWPGTQLAGDRARVRHYRITDESMAALRAVHGLYGWLAPELPEDLAFYLAGGECWLATVSHDEQGWFMDAKLTPEEVQRSVPGIEVRAGSM